MLFLLERTLLTATVVVRVPLSLFLSLCRCVSDAATERNLPHMKNSRQQNFLGAAAPARRIAAARQSPAAVAAAALSQSSSSNSRRQNDRSLHTL